MKSHRYKPIDRRYANRPPVTFYEDLPLVAVPASGFFKARAYAGAPDTPYAVRFGITDSGRLLSGDGNEVLHPDACRCALAVGDFNTLLVGFAVLRGETWEMRLQGLACRKPHELVARLSTWHEFTAGAKLDLRVEDILSMEAP